jgi:hypothetical protein
MRGKACHTLRSFVKATIWRRSKKKNTCSLFVQVHRKSRNASVRPFPSLTLALLLTHANYEHGCPGQVCDMLPVLEDNLSSMIYLSSNGLSGPKRTLNCK